MALFRQPTATYNYLQKEFSEMIKIMKDRNVEEGNHIVVDELIMEIGKAYTKAVVYRDDMAIALSWFAKGSISKKHRHFPYIETIFILEGKCNVVYYSEGKMKCEIQYNEDDKIVIPAGEVHQFFFLEETRIIAKTVPADPTFPKTL